MRLSWAQGAVAALTLTAAVGLLDTPSRLLGPASVVESPLSLPQASSPSIVIAALPAPIVHSSARHAPSRHAALIAAPPPSLAVGPVVRLPVPVQPQAPQPKAAKPAALPTPRRRIPPDEPRPSPAPTPVPPPPAPRPAPAPPVPTDTPTTPALTPPLEPPPPPLETPSGDEGKPACPAASGGGRGHEHNNDHPPNGKACGYNK